MSVKIQRCTLTVAFLVTSSLTCVLCSTSLENKVGQLEARQAIVEGRSSAVSNAFSNELGQLQRDSNGIKTALSRLVEDSVDIRRKLNTLQNLGQDITVLRKQIGDVKNTMTERVTETEGQVRAVSNNMEQDRRKEATKLNAMNVQLDENKRLEASLRTELSGQTKKLTALENRVTALSDVTGSPVALKALQTTVDKAWRKIDDMQSKYGSQLEGLRNSIDDMKRQQERKDIYREQ